MVSAALAKQLAAAGGTCEKAVDSALKDADAYQLTVQKVAIGTSPTAAAQVKVDTGKEDRIQSIGLEKQGQGWRISRLR